jgi:hypothetical protein
LSPLAVEWRHWLLEAGLTAGSFFMLAWILQYSWYQPWWKDPIGRTFVYIDVLLLLVFVPLLISAWWHLTISVTVWLSWLLVVAILAVPVVLAWRMVVWRNIRKAGRKKDHASRS